MRIILYTGKGGVGKTSVAAATALRCAELGYKTIILSTDAAHSLSDSFDVALNAKQSITPNLWAQETDLAEATEKYWGTIQGWLSSLLAWRGIEEIAADELAVLPGMEELASLLYIVDYWENEEYDVIIVDCAPTGDTLRLLSFPEILRWWMDKLFPVERKVISVTRPLIKRVLKAPLPEENVLDSMEGLFEQLMKMRALLSDPEQTSVRLVVNAEKMVIKETQRTFTYLNLYGYVTDLIVCNRLLPKEVDGRYFDSWKQSQRKYYQMIEENFAPLPIRSIPFFDQEVVGGKMLQAMGEALFGAEDPSKLYFQGQTQRIDKDGDGYVLAMSLPFLSKEDISLTRSGNELVVKAGKQKRNITLPQTLIGLEVQGAKYEGDKLHIRFQGKKAD